MSSRDVLSGLLIPRQILGSLLTDGVPHGRSDLGAVDERRCRCLCTHADHQAIRHGSSDLGTEKNLLLSHVIDHVTINHGQSALRKYHGRYIL